MSKLPLLRYFSPALRRWVHTKDGSWVVESKPGCDHAELEARGELLTNKDTAPDQPLARCECGRTWRVRGFA